MLTIRAAKKTDNEEIWEIFKEVVSAGDTYVYDPSTTMEEFLDHWFGDSVKTYVAVEGGTLLGTYILKPNQPGLGSHIANASYMVREEGRGRGIGSEMCRHSLKAAKDAGFRAMQFNFVVETNVGAISLWSKFGFEILGTIPEAFRHPSGRFVNAHIMYRKL